VEEIVVARDVRAVVADVSEKRALRPFVVERERQRANRSRRRSQADAHVHRDAELPVMRPLECENFGGRLAGLMLEEIDRVAGVVPEQMVDPAPRLALEIDVLAAEEEGLDDEMLKLELAG